MLLGESEEFCWGTTVNKYVISILILINTQKYVLIYEKRENKKAILTHSWELQSILKKQKISLLF
jgi:hypothetical protein